ncbi:RRXRR domain-containing protein [Allochromatium warmingii]|uniref:RRXRR domain-containing protein n=1 Tax=Allochromatium warmingii TaxID=61595 RepID=UPI000B867473|nr:RRXRR domain-containing protein [Allochromatium warmingii]
MNTNFVFVLDTERRPLSPCHPARARELLRTGKAALLRRLGLSALWCLPQTDH